MIFSFSLENTIHTVDNLNHQIAKHLLLDLSDSRTGPANESTINLLLARFSIVRMKTISTFYLHNYSINAMISLRALLLVYRPFFTQKFETMLLGGQSLLLFDTVGLRIYSYVRLLASAMLNFG